LFRKDINGLRAIAVIAVVLFHFKPNWIEGGFAGVDVFFVISGFLMTGLSLEVLSEMTFQFLSFILQELIVLFPHWLYCAFFYY
jgi:peptidoglycan/LPS O-acetylase OafA/YrhL